MSRHGPRSKRLLLGPGHSAKTRSSGCGRLAFLGAVALGVILGAIALASHE